MLIKRFFFFGWGGGGGGFFFLEIVSTYDVSALNDCFLSSNQDTN